MKFKKVCWVCGKPANKMFSEQTYAFPITQGGARFPEMKEAMLLSEDEIDRRVNKGFSKISIPRMYCEECFERERKELSKRQLEYGRTKKMLMLERALRTMEKQNLNMYDYKDIVADMAEYIKEKPEKFDSSHEIIAAIILVDNEIKCKIQHKVGKYRADFYIPELKIILEIDGELHKAQLFKDNQRDIKIREILGNDWEVVRIGTEYIEKNAEMLVEAMIKIKEEKQKIRKSNFGVLPEWYSSRDKAKRTRSFKIGDDNLLLDI